MPDALRDRATDVTEHMVSSFPQISGVCLFGSVARGDAGPDSDLDLLVVGDDPKLTPSSIRRRLRLDDATPKVSIVYHTPATLGRYVRTGSRFLLHVQLEGEVLYDERGLLRDLQSLPPVSAPVRAEVDGQLKRLTLYDDTDRYNGNFLFPLSHIYAIGKAIVMAILAENKIFEFNRDRAFEAFSARFPESSQEVAIVARLSPFYRLASKGVEAELPFSYHNCEIEVRKAVRAVRSLAAHARST
ncbi:MAG TPA: nucleotidyltransferase domain-containing protein [Solirubrobacteraceae bacterium]|nr:nucleotidyltransferase domain-containing protein [Solirubrobacteraceae bacterium]